MSTQSRSDPPSDIDTMHATSIIGTAPVDWEEEEEEEEVNTEDDCYKGAYNVGIDVDDEVFVHHAMPVVTQDFTRSSKSNDDSHNTEATTNSDDSISASTSGTAPRGSAVAANKEVINHLRASAGNVYNVAQVSNEVANSENTGQFLWNSINLGIATAGTINGLIKHPSTNNVSHSTGPAVDGGDHSRA